MQPLELNLSYLMYRDRSAAVRRCACSYSIYSHKSQSLTVANVIFFSATIYSTVCSLRVIHSRFQIVATGDWLCIFLDLKKSQK